jgi:hypothetical protein
MRSLTLFSSQSRYLKSYVKYIRPRVNPVDDLLFVNSKGKGNGFDAGICIRRFFEDHGGLHITTTTIRYVAMRITVGYSTDLL